jgi:hypothetical protein
VEPDPEDEQSLLRAHIPTDGPIGVLIEQRPDLMALAAELTALHVEAIVVQHTVDGVFVPLVVFDGGTHWQLEARPTRDAAYSAGVICLKELAKVLARVRKKSSPAIFSDELSARVAAETAVRLWRRRDRPPI